MPGFLAETIKRILHERSDVQFVIAGPGLRKPFPRCSTLREFNWPARSSARKCRRVLASSRFLLASSRWETQPIGTLEALRLGATVVAPALPGFLELADDGASGTLSKTRMPEDLARAALLELEQWDRGTRNPVAIAQRWRVRVSNDAVARGLLASLNEKIRVAYDMSFCADLHAHENHVTGVGRVAEKYRAPSGAIPRDRTPDDRVPWRRFPSRF